MDILEKALRWAETWLTWSHPGILGAIGGVANYYYLNVTKNRKFVWGALLANAILAFFLGRALSGMLPLEEGETREGLVMLIGFFAFPILHALETHVVAMVGRLLQIGGK